jgi:hypothetical protein
MRGGPKTNIASKLFLCIGGHMRRIAVGALIVAGTLLMVASSSTADSSTGSRVKATSVSCSALSGINNPGKELKLSRCTSPTGSSGVVAAPFFTPSVIHWTAGGTTTVTFDGTPKEHSAPGCAVAVTLTKGVVKHSTVPGIKGKFHASFCFHSAKISLVPGTKMTFG